MITSPLQNMKIRIKNPEHSEQVQECLFKLGFGWLGVQKTPQFTEKPYMFAEKSGARVSYASDGDELYYSNEPSKEVTLEELQAMLAEPEDDAGGDVHCTSDIQEFSVDNTINTYMSQIQKRLAETNLAVAIYEDRLEVVDMNNEYQLAVVHDWGGVLKAIEVKQVYLDVFKGNDI